MPFRVWIENWAPRMLQAAMLLLIQTLKYLLLCPVSIYHPSSLVVLTRYPP